MRRLEPMTLRGAGQGGGGGDGGSTPPTRLPERYEDRGYLGEGAMSTVRRVRDLKLDQDLAMKILRHQHATRVSVRHRFGNEARMQANLRHPCILPVHDMGELPDGRLWFTMPVVEGRTLRDLVTAVHKASPGSSWGESPDGYGLRDLIEVVAHVADAIGHAGAQGIVHRDLKPSNIMVGAFREVLVMDWGIAKKTGEQDAEADTSAFGQELGAHQTQVGKAVGTPPYMAPEQAMGDPDRVDGRSDVYALGSTLYKVLTGRSPYRGKPRDVLIAVRRGPPHPVSTRGRLPVPEELARLCERCMARDPSGRPAEAGVVAAALRAWLDRRARSVEVQPFVARARQCWQAIQDMDGQEARVRDELEVERQRRPAWAPLEERRVVWRLEDQLRSLERHRVRLEAEVLQQCRAALARVSDLTPARALVADVYRERFERARSRGDAEGARIAETQVRLVDPAGHADWLTGVGWLSLATDPPGARVDAYRFEDRAGILEPVRRGSLGVTPLERVRLEEGSWLLELRAPGREVVRYPVQVTRQERVDTTRPGSPAPHRVWLPPAGAVPEDACYVPAGWFRAGGTQGIEPLSPRRIWVDGFLISRFPVTAGEWHAFLADRLVHRLPLDGLVPEALIEHDHLGLRVRTGVEPLQPVLGITYAAVGAYLRWRSAVDGVRWRLPHDLEWEKAGRGVDGRLVPWGSRLDPSLAHVLGSRADNGPVDVHAHPTDVSVYGMRQVVGNVSEYHRNRWSDDPVPDGGLLDPDQGLARPGDTWIMTRGGGRKQLPASAVLPSRLVQGGGFFMHSFRLCRSVP